ncbi:MAG: hypothetical protein JWR13_5031 [Mycobacterium sp.]|jgi:hypothetical protein|nr:hypothetical protein [Mycobacterium sp.]MCW2734215.1 hypothetical protein [Mycobacterium sp.]MDT5072872.1 hypothetical protein [Mycobacterium sp.]MDT5311969.1 hypothetical protein [Mycobacterium sp.]
MTNTTARTLAHYLALPLLAAGIAGGALLGTAGAASAAPSISSNDSGNFYAPTIRATPPVLVQPGARWHRQHNRFNLGAE